MPLSIFVIMDTAYSGDLADDARQGSVWIVASPNNEAAANHARAAIARECPIPDRITTFTADADDDLALAGLLTTIRTHHGELAASSPWDSIHVIGRTIGHLRPSRIATALGLHDVELVEEPSGFVIHRSRPQRG
ncbi:MAG: hypothetical protein KDC95_18340 [Planctomycetes bacterium]|nr:hypothetical protein [Planctomycetota bacterium]